GGWGRYDAQRRTTTPAIVDPNRHHPSHPSDMALTAHRPGSSLAAVGPAHARPVACAGLPPEPFSTTSEDQPHMNAPQHAGHAWYSASRLDFLLHASDDIAARLASAAAHSGWHIEEAQAQEWDTSVKLLQARLRGPAGEPLRILQRALVSDGAEAIESIVLEYDFRRRGLRMDCLLLALGALLVLEFKRGKLDGAARDQLMGYCVSLAEFHTETRRWLAQQAIVCPILCSTGGQQALDLGDGTFLDGPWAGLRRQPIRCDAQRLGEAIRHAVAQRKTQVPMPRATWLASEFSPSSTIVDAAVSLYGQHDVSAIRAHAAPVQDIRLATASIREQIQAARRDGRRHIVFLSGAPGAGKTLVGLNLAFDPEWRNDAVFVTGNAPLVEVLEAALQGSYRRSAGTRGTVVASGYRREHAGQVVGESTFKIVKAHRFLGERGKHTASSDGSIVIFDEAQRTYEKGKVVLGHALADHEADLILAALEASYARGTTVVALLGQNQAINRGERGAVAWFEAAERRGWTFAVADETLAMAELAKDPRWSTHSGRRPLEHGHLQHSMRFYRNAGLERWAHLVMEDCAEEAREVAAELERLGHTIWLVRDIDVARHWARERRVGDERAGIIASGQARRLAAHGLHVELKPDIATWMLAATDDFRSSNSLETVQNTYQIQGLEIDWAIVCWDADLRRGAHGWEAFKLSGGAWQRDREVEVAKNGYRVLLTRARKGMVVFVPEGDGSGEDGTRCAAWYDGVAGFLVGCGARRWEMPFP
ncbi:MAG: DNA/RNA helicase domain-containing protein, partial [Myxococcota bacterium]